MILLPYLWFVLKIISLFVFISKTQIDNFYSVVSCMFICFSWILKQVVELQNKFFYRVKEQFVDLTMSLYVVLLANSLCTSMKFQFSGLRKGTRKHYLRLSRRLKLVKLTWFSLYINYVFRQNPIWMKSWGIIDIWVWIQIYCRADDSGFHFATADFWAELHCQNLYSNKGCKVYVAMCSKGINNRRGTT